MNPITLLRPFTVAAAVLALAAAPAGAQQPVNGYPELVRAAEVLATSRLFPKVADGRASLVDQRAALAEKPVQESLRLLRLALSRPAVTVPPTARVETLLQDSTAARSLGRLLRVQQYVLLAEGRTRDAILNARLCLSLGTATQGGTLVTGLTGLAISGMGIQTFGRHLEQLSHPDCELLYQVCLEWLNRPDPMVQVLNGEREFGKRSLATQFASAPAEPGATPEETRRAQAVVRELLASVEKEIDAYYGRVFEELRKPPWERARVAAPPGQSAAATIVGLVAPVVSRSFDTWAREMAQVRLLACHARVLRFRWEQNRLPSSLQELGLGDVATDPFTGRPLRYEPLGDRAYRLTSAGPRAQPNDPAAVEGRIPLSVTGVP